MGADLWFPFARPAPSAESVLFCFAHAGGGASVFRRWREALAPDVEVLAAQLPGRETRITEVPATDLAPLVTRIAEAALPRIRKPYSLFGHSLGALVAYRVALALVERGAAAPTRLFVSGANAPHRRLAGPDLHGVDDARLLSEVARLGDTPTEVLSNRELMAILLPVLRADFALSETFTHRDPVVLDAPITAFAGAEDPAVSEEGLAAWRDCTSRGASVERLPGGHFYFRHDAGPLLDLVRRELRLARPPAPRPPV